MMKLHGKEYSISVLPKLHLPDTTFEQMFYIQSRLDAKNFTETLIPVIHTVYNLLKTQEEYYKTGKVPESIPNNPEGAMPSANEVEKKNEDT